MDYSKFVGHHVIIRSNLSGAHFGTLQAIDGNVVLLTESRRLWRWDAAPHGISLSDVAIHGPVGDRSMVCVEVEMIIIYDVIEVILASDDCARVVAESAVAKP